jgi:FkbM family methyltransferase
LSIIRDSAIAFYDNLTPKKIYAFEPEPNNYELLCETIKNNKLEEIIIPIKYAISNRKTTLLISSNDGASALSEIYGDFKVNTITIDDFVDQNNIDVGIIKMDIEGHEYEAIQGAINTIKEHRPVLLISIYHRGKDFFEIKPLLEKHLDEYKYLVRKLNPLNPIMETMLICYPKN